MNSIKSNTPAQWFYAFMAALPLALVLLLQSKPVYLLAILIFFSLLLVSKLWSPVPFNRFSILLPVLGLTGIAFSAITVATVQLHYYFLLMLAAPLFYWNLQVKNSYKLSHVLLFLQGLLVVIAAYSANVQMLSYSGFSFLSLAIFLTLYPIASKNSLLVAASLLFIVLTLLLEGSAFTSVTYAVVSFVICAYAVSDYILFKSKYRFLGFAASAALPLVVMAVIVLVFFKERALLSLLHSASTAEDYLGVIAFNAASTDLIHSPESTPFILALFIQSNLSAYILALAYVCWNIYLYFIHRTHPLRSKILSSFNATFVLSLLAPVYLSYLVLGISLLTVGLLGLRNKVVLKTLDVSKTVPVRVLPVFLGVLVFFSSAQLIAPSYIRSEISFKNYEKMVLVKETRNPYYSTYFESKKDYWALEFGAKFYLNKYLENPSSPEAQTNLLSAYKMASLGVQNSSGCYNCMGLLYQITALQNGQDDVLALAYKKQAREKNKFFLDN